MKRILVIAGLVLLSNLGTAQTARKLQLPAAPVSVTKHLSAVPMSQAGPTPMSDGALDKTTAAGISASMTNGVIAFQGQVPTANGLVSAAGTLLTQTGPLTGANIGTLSLNGSAQQNLSSLVNINAVNSNINVLLNLNVNINSTVGSILQSNLNGKH